SADCNLSTSELREVERVQGLATLHQYAIGDVDDAIDASDANRLEPHREPLGAGTDLHPAYHAGRVAFAQLGAGDLHPHHLVDMLLPGLRLRVGLLERPAPQHRYLAADANVP